MRAGIGILSDGMSSRLFDRVREQQGLCYTVTASCHSIEAGRRCFWRYAGTTPERAQQTLDVTLREISHLVDDLNEAELRRWQTRIQSLLIMEQESSAPRASSLASDYQIGHPISTKELESAIEALTLDQVREYWKAHPPGDYRIVTLGPDRLSTPQDSHTSSVN